MFESLLASLPPAWREVATAVLSLIAWIPAWQGRVMDMVLTPNASWPAVIGVWVLLALPAFLVVLAIWSTMLSAYTLPFRSGRVAYLRTLAFSWWDAGRGITVYWAGVVRFILTAGGLLWSALRYTVAVLLRVIKSLFTTPAAALDWTARRYFEPGVPWLAFVLVLGWSALEAAVFAFTLRPIVYGVLFDMTGGPPNGVMLAMILYTLLFLLIAGSFACIQALTEAIERRAPKAIGQMLLVQIFVMSFEVVFLYRGLIDATTPWIAQQTGDPVRLGFWSTVALASFGWIGVRGTTWFLFGRHGTPPLVAVLSRETVGAGDVGDRGEADVLDWWTSMVTDLKQEQAWLRAQAEQLAETLVLPILQLLAIGLNFLLVLVSARPAFDLPFESMEQAMARLPQPGRLEGAGPDLRSAGTRRARLNEAMKEA